jgi:hypothetical protein
MCEPACLTSRLSNSRLLKRARIRGETGFPPAVDDPRLKAGEVLLWLPIEGDGPLEDLLERGRAGDATIRAVVATGSVVRRSTSLSTKPRLAGFSTRLKIY